MPCVHNDQSNLLLFLQQQQDFNAQQQLAHQHGMVNSIMKQPNNKPLPSSRYKTELCRPFEEFSTCKYGEKCQFAHGLHELRTLTRHPKYKTELCRTFHTLGLCPYGHRCHFIHNEAEYFDEIIKRQMMALKNEINSSSASSSLPALATPGGSLSSGSSSPVNTHHHHQGGIVASQAQPFQIFQPSSPPLVPQQLFQSLMMVGTTNGVGGGGPPSPPQLVNTPSSRLPVFWNLSP